MKLFSTFTILVIILISACEPIERLTMLKTVSYEAGKAKGHIIDLSDKSHSEYGFVFDSLQNPTVLKQKTSLGTPQVGDFEILLPLLYGSWYIKSYIAENSDFVYGNEINVLIGKPLVNISSTSELDDISATIVGTINPKNNLITSLSLEYDTTTNFEMSAPATPNTVSGDYATNVSVSLSGLLPKTKYFCRLRVLYYQNLLYSNTIEFTTY